MHDEVQQHARGPLSLTCFAAGGVAAVLPREPGCSVSCKQKVSACSGAGEAKGLQGSKEGTYFADTQSFRSCSFWTASSPLLPALLQVGLDHAADESQCQGHARAGHCCEEECVQP